MKRNQIKSFYGVVCVLAILCSQVTVLVYGAPQISIENNGNESPPPPPPETVIGTGFSDIDDNIAGPISRPTSAVFPDALRKMAHTSIQFAWDSYRALQVPSGQNVFFSPYSIMNALGMLVLGSSGSTSFQLQQALRVHPSLQNVGLHVGLSEENDKLREDREATFGLANRFFVDLDTAPNIDPDYVNELDRVYNATMKRTPFASDPTEAKQLINGFISNNTFGEIDNFLTSNPDPNTKIMLVNAIYFKGLWTVPFRPQFTTSMIFSSTSGNVTADFMYQRTVLPYTFHQQLGCEMFALPYTKNKQYGMYILLPRPGVDLASVEESLDGEQLLRLQNSLLPMSVEIRLPRFQMEKQLSLRQMLSNLGADVVFDPLKSDYSKMFVSKRPGVFVDDVLHEAKVKVDEEGTVAAAATAVVVIRTNPIFRSIFVDRPFLFFIADQSNGFILFWGRVEDPTSG